MLTESQKKKIARLKKQGYSVSKISLETNSNMADIESFLIGSLWSSYLDDSSSSSGGSGYSDSSSYSSSSSYSDSSSSSSSSGSCD